MNGVRYVNKILRMSTIGFSFCVVMDRITTIDNKPHSIMDKVYADDILSKPYQESIKLSTIIDYENKIRLYSPPEKVFRYFASKRHFKHPNEIYMTPNDFLRSYMLNVVSNDDGYGLDKYETIDPKKYCCHIQPDSVFYYVSNNGLINYYDYLFLMIILCTDEAHLEVVFNTIDINNDGVISKEEFINAIFLFLKKSIFSKKYGSIELEKIYHSMNDLNVVNKLFKDPKYDINKKQAIPIEKLIEFCRQLKIAISRLEFNYFEPIDGKISEENFATLIISSSKSMIMKRNKIKKRLYNLCNKLPSNRRGISLEQYVIFCHFLERISLASVALEFCWLNGDNVDKPIFKHIVKSLVKEQLEDHVIDVIFAIFDENGDQLLSNEEFTYVMKNRSERGFKRLKDTGISSLFDALYQCAKNNVNTLKLFYGGNTAARLQHERLKLGAHILEHGEYEFL